MIQSFRKKPVVIEAMQVPKDRNDMAAWGYLIGWISKVPFEIVEISNGKLGLRIGTLEGAMLASPSDWIIRGVKGEFYPCKPDIFAATYDKVDP